MKIQLSDKTRWVSYAQIVGSFLMMMVLNYSPASAQIVEIEDVTRVAHTPSIQFESLNDLSISIQQEWRKLWDQIFIYSQKRNQPVKKSGRLFEPKTQAVEVAGSSSPSVGLKM